MKSKKLTESRRHKRVRAKIFGTAGRPRLCVFRSTKHIYCQLINDEKGKILISANDFDLKKGKKLKTEIAREVGKLIAKKALEKKIETVAFDRRGYKYHGRIKALAEGAREAGLKF